MVMIKSWTQNV